MPTVADNFEIKNQYRDISDGSGEIVCAVTSEDGVGVIEHVLIDGGNSTNNPGIYVDHGQHDGTLILRNVHVRQCVDQGLYGENADWKEGNDGSGRIILEDCYFHDNAGGNVRVNGNSEIRNTHIHNTNSGPTDRGSQGFLTYYESTGGEVHVYNSQVEVTDENTAGPSAVAVDLDHPENCPPWTFHESQIRGPIQGESNMTMIGGGNNPSINPPRGVPMTPEEAENGTSSATGPTWEEISGDGSDDGGSVPVPPRPSPRTDKREVSIVANDSVPAFSWSLTATGEVLGYYQREEWPADSEDTTTQNSDGTYTATGQTGNGGGDTITVEGVVTEFEIGAASGDYTTYLDGQPAGVAEIVNTDVPDVPENAQYLRFDGPGTDPGDGQRYEVKVSSGKLWRGTEFDPDKSSNLDTIDQDGTRAIGEVFQSYYDDLWFTGEIESITLENPDTQVSVDGYIVDSSDVGGEDNLIDSFEDGDISEYTFDPTRENLATVVSSPTRSGSHALELGGTNTELISTPELPRYPTAGDTISYWVRGTNNADDTNFSYGVQDHENRYFVRVDLANSDLYLFRYQNGGATQLASNTTGYTLSQDVWYEVEIQWGTDGTHTVTLFDSSGSQLVQVTGSDATWTSGGIGFDAYLSGSQAAYFDNVTLK